MKAPKVQPVHRAGDVVVVKSGFIPVLILTISFCRILTGQDLPVNELQVNFSGYFDSFNVNVLYPNISLTTRVSESTSINARYLVDMITAASIRGSSNKSGVSENDERGFDDKISPTSRTTATKKVDAVTAASSSGGRFEQPSFDDVRNEFNLGVTHLFAGNRISVNGIYSRESDYSSKTIAGTISRNFALKNTMIELGYVHSWDLVFPVTKGWTRTKNVVTYSANFSQLLGKNALIQFLSSYMEYSGYLADAYQQISIGPPDNPTPYDPVHPDKRIRRALGSEFKFRVSQSSSVQIGYRYYWDSWEIRSHTISTNYMTYLSPHVIFDLGLRHYLQSRAYFFKPEYTQPEDLMTADIKLEEGYSNEVQLGLTLSGGRDQDYLPFLTDENVQYNLALNIYQRHTLTGYWFNGEKNLIATDFNIGIRYRF